MSVAELIVTREQTVNYEATAQAANLAFEEHASFTPDRLRWLYSQGYSHGCTVIAAFSGPRKVAQVALINQPIDAGGTLHKAVLLVDLFVVKEFRSLRVLTGLAGEVGSPGTELEFAL